MKHNPGQDRIYHMLGKTFARMAEYEKAIDTYYKGIAINIMNFNIVKDLGDAFIKINMPRQAVGFYRHVVKYLSDDFDFLMSLGIALNLCGSMIVSEEDIEWKKISHTLAVKYFREANKLVPNSADALFNLAYTFVLLGDKKIASAVCGRLAQISKERAEELSAIIQYMHIIPTAPVPEKKQASTEKADSSSEKTESAMTNKGANN